MTDLPMNPPKLFLPQVLMTLFLRLVALGCLWFALHLWGGLVGYTANGTLRFDLLGTDMQAANATLAVLYPVAAIGLWLRGAWGPVIWSAAAAMELAMHQGFPQTFGNDPVKVMIIALTVLFYLILRLAVVLLKPAKTPAG
jgi:hypothetical protein